MPYKDPEKQREYKKEYYQKKNKEYMKEYYEKNKEKILEQQKEYMKEYREKNKEKIKEQRKEYREKNKEYYKEYNQTETGKKSCRITNWKKRGIKSDDYNSLYDYYINCKNCELCNVELVEGLDNNSKCLDHDHESGLFRNVLCRSCNVKRG